MVDDGLLLADYRIAGFWLVRLVDCSRLLVKEAKPLSRFMACATVLALWPALSWVIPQALGAEHGFALAPVPWVVAMGVLAPPIVYTCISPLW